MFSSRTARADGSPKRREADEYYAYDIPSPVQRVSKYYSLDAFDIVRYGDVINRHY